jgi:hypothetical protein
MRQMPTTDMRTSPYAATAVPVAVSSTCARRHATRTYTHTCGLVWPWPGGVARSRVVDRLHTRTRICGQVQRQGRGRAAGAGRAGTREPVAGGPCVPRLARHEGRRDGETGRHAPSGVTHMAQGARCPRGRAWGPGGTAPAPWAVPAGLSHTVQGDVGRRLRPPPPPARRHAHARTHTHGLGHGHAPRGSWGAWGPPGAR